MIHEGDNVEQMKLESENNREWLYDYYKKDYKVLVTRNFDNDHEDVVDLERKQDIKNPLTWVPGKLYSILDIIDFLKEHIDFFVSSCNCHGFLAIEEWDGYEGTSYGRLGFVLVKGEVYNE